MKNKNENKENNEKENIANKNIANENIANEYSVFREYKGLYDSIELVTQIVHTHLDEPVVRAFHDTHGIPGKD